MDIDNGNVALLEADDFDSVEATISDVGVMFHLLTTIYSDRPRIVVQEYLANSRDAHRFLNKENIPFDIIIPTPLHSEFSVRDYGPGIKDEDMENVFIRLGSSTKRTVKKLNADSGKMEVTPESANNVKMTGGFGIGAKSAFCYTDNFTVESYVDGMLRTYSFVLGGQAEDGTIRPPRLFRISAEETTEPNGVKIIVGIKDEDRLSFINHVYRTTQFWEHRPNIVNGHTSDITWSDMDTYFKGEKWLYLKKSYGTHIVVDGIPYGFNLNAVYNDGNDIERYRRLFDNRRFIFNFEAGDILINPNREAIQYDNISVMRIREVINSALTEIRTKAQSTVDACNTKDELRKVMDDFYEIKNITGEMKWRGINLKNYHFNRDLVDVYIYNIHRRKIHRSTVTYSVNCLENSPSYIFINDEDEIDIRRIQTLMNRGYNFIVVDFKRYHNYVKDNPDVTEAMFDDMCDEYDREILKFIGYRFLSEIEEYIKPKIEKVPGNIYKFSHNTSSSREAWEKLDVDYGEVEGYYVQFERGNAEGFSLCQLEKIKNTLDITIYGVPERFISKLNNNEYMTPLKEFIEEKITEFKEKVEEAKEQIYIRNKGYSEALDVESVFKRLGLSFTREFAWIPEIQNQMNTVAKIQMLNAEPFNYKKIKDTIEFLDQINNTRLGIIDSIPEYELSNIKTIINNYYPMFRFVSMDSIEYGQHNDLLLKHIKDYNEKYYPEASRIAFQDYENFSYEI